MKINKNYRNLIVIITLTLFLIASCREKKKPMAPVIETGWNNTPSNQTSESTCQSQGGIDCQGCCQNPISSNILTCCKPNKCIERMQFHVFIEDLGDITIEKFPRGNYGVWYGEKDLNFGNRQYVDAEYQGNDKYKFVINDKEYYFTSTIIDCIMSIRIEI